MRFLRSDSRFYGLLQCFFRALLIRAIKSRALGEKGVHWFFPAFERPCISSLPCIIIPCIGLRAIYVPASVFTISCKIILQLHFEPVHFPCNPALQNLRKWLCLFLISRKSFEIVWHHANDVLIEIVRARKLFDFIVIFRHAMIAKIVRNRFNYTSCCTNSHKHDKIRQAIGSRNCY